MITSRGCPHECGFCADYVIYRRRWNALSAERVVAELVRLHGTYTPRSFRIVDSNFFVNEGRVVAICEGILRHGIHTEFLKVNGDVFLLDRYADSTLRLMRTAGIKNILLGIESGHPEALACIRKRSTSEQALSVVARLRENGISVGHSLMLGFPYDLPVSRLEEEHRREFVATMKLVGQLSEDYIPGDYYLLFHFTPYPGVRLFDRYVDLGFLPPKTLGDWSSVNLNNTTPPWVSEKTVGRMRECTMACYFFSGKFERAWSVYQYYRFRWLPRTFYLRLVKVANSWVRRVLRNRLRRDVLELPWWLREWYRLEMAFVYGRRGSDNVPSSTILASAAKRVWERLRGKALSVFALRAGDPDK